MDTLAIIEDDVAIRRVLELALKSAGYGVVAEESGEGGLELVRRTHPRLVLLDIMLPGLDGLSVCRRLRADAETAEIPIIMLTAKGEERDVIAGLDAGATDYVTKPFSKAVLLARIRAALRRPESQEAVTLTLDGLVIDTSAHAVRLAGNPLALTLSEYRILELLVRNVNRVFTRTHIIDRISDGQKLVTDRTVDVQMVNLRHKLGDWSRHIKTIRGVGYRAE